MEDFVMFIVVGIGSFLAGWYIREWYATFLMNRFLSRVEDRTLDALEKIKQNVLKIKIEKHEDRLFVYSLDDHEFMAQGGTREELEDALRARYPGKTFAAEEANLKEVGFVHESL